VYCYHLLFTIAGVNNYTDITRNAKCDSASRLTADQNSAIMDTAILIVTIFHMAEWIRWLLFLTSALVNVDLIKPYIVLSAINIPFGVIALLWGIIGRFGSAAA